jgi:hypothetical protein
VQSLANRHAARTCQLAALAPPAPCHRRTGRVGNKKKPTQKTTKSVFFGFFILLIFYENNTNFSL